MIPMLILLSFIVFVGIELTPGIQSTILFRRIKRVLQI